MTGSLIAEGLFHILAALKLMRATGCTRRSIPALRNKQPEWYVTKQRSCRKRDLQKGVRTIAKNGMGLPYQVPRSMHHCVHDWAVEFTSDERQRKASDEVYWTTGGEPCHERNQCPDICPLVSRRGLTGQVQRGWILPRLGWTGSSLRGASSATLASASRATLLAEDRPGSGVVGVVSVCLRTVTITQGVRAIGIVVGPRLRDTMALYQGLMD
jgi:hypothetical protein